MSTLAFVAIASSLSDCYFVDAKAKKDGKWIGKIRIKKGAFRADLHRLGILKGDEPIQLRHIDEALKIADEKGDTKLARRANLARNLIKVGRKHRADVAKAA
jgi:hypothetical protein